MVECTTCVVPAAALLLAVAATGGKYKVRVLVSELMISRSKGIFVHAMTVAEAGAVVAFSTAPALATTPAETTVTDAL